MEFAKVYTQYLKNLIKYMSPFLFLPMSPEMPF